MPLKVTSAISDPVCVVSVDFVLTDVSPEHARRFRQAIMDEALRLAHDLDGTVHARGTPEHRTATPPTPDDDVLDPDTKVPQNAPGAVVVYLGGETPAALPASAPLPSTVAEPGPCCSESIAPLTPPDPARGAHRDSVPPEEKKASRPDMRKHRIDEWRPEEDAVYERASCPQHMVERYRQVFPDSKRSDGAIRARYKALQLRESPIVHRRDLGTADPEV